MTQLQAETNPRSFVVAVNAWKANVNGAQYRSIVSATIARCSGQQEIGASPPSASASVAPGPPARTVKLSKADYAKRFRWPHGSRNMAHTCLEGAAVANGMSCSLAQAIEAAFGKYPDGRTPMVRSLHLVDPDTGHTVSVDCAVSGQQNASAVCDAPQHQVALLPPPDFSS